jgi:site-specific recombinase XerD
MFTRYRVEAGIDRPITFHSLRHSFCTMLAEAGKSAIVIKEAARHADVSTSMRYVHIANNHLRAEIDDVFA